MSKPPSKRLFVGVRVAADHPRLRTYEQLNAQAKAWATAAVLRVSLSRNGSSQVKIRMGYPEDSFSVEGSIHIGLGDPYTDDAGRESDKPWQPFTDKLEQTKAALVREAGGRRVMKKLKLALASRFPGFDVSGDGLNVNVSRKDSYSTSIFASHCEGQSYSAQIQVDAVTLDDILDIARMFEGLWMHPLTDGNDEP